MTMLKNLYLIVVLTFFFAVFKTAHANESSLFFGAGGSYVVDNFDSSGTPLDFNPSVGVNVKAGLKIDEAFDVEIDLITLNGFDEQNAQKVIIDGYAITVNGKWVERRETASPYVLLGIGLATINSSSLDVVTVNDTASITRFGGGIEYSLSSKIMLYAEGSYYLPPGDLKYFNFLPFTLGVKLLL